MSGFQVIVKYGDKSFDSIRDTDRQALHKVADYMKQDADSIVVMCGHVIQDKLVFGHSVESITALIKVSDFELLVKYIP